MKKITTVNSNGEKLLYHPLCHMFVGERLQYYFIRIDSSLKDFANDLKNFLVQTRLESSCCSFAIFGSSDIILRIWAMERSIVALKDFLHKNDKILDYKEYLIDNINTWYQRKIEKRKNWQTLLSTENFTNICSSRIDEDLYLKYTSRIQKIEEIRFFILFELPFNNQQPLFYDLKKLISSDFFKSKLLDNISIYSFTTNKNKGVIIKGQTNDLKHISEAVFPLLEEFKNKELNSTTYICSNRLLIENDNFTIDSQEFRPDNIKKPDIAYNLLRRHDCNNFLFKTENDHLNKSFISGVASILDVICNSHSELWEHLQLYRQIYKWIILQKNNDLIQFLMGQYVMYEKALRQDYENLYDFFFPFINNNDFNLQDKLRRISEDEIKSLPDKSKEILYILKKSNSKSQKNKSLTLSNFERLLQLYDKKVITDFCKKNKIEYLTKTESQDISRLIDILSRCKENRNKIMHGEVTNLFEHNNDNWYFHSYIVNIIELTSIYHKAKPANNKLNKIMKMIMNESKITVANTL